MNCRQLQESLGDHSVGLLDSHTLSDFERHVTLCAECARTVRQFQRLLELLDHAASPRPPGDLWIGVRASMEVERSIQSHARLLRRAPARWPWRSSLAATAAGFAVAAVVMMGLSAQRPDPMSLADDRSGPIMVPVSAGTPPFVPDVLQVGVERDAGGEMRIPIRSDAMPPALRSPLDLTFTHGNEVFHMFPYHSGMGRIVLDAGGTRPDARKALPTATGPAGNPAR